VWWWHLSDEVNCILRTYLCERSVWEVGRIVGSGCGRLAVHDLWSSVHLNTSTSSLPALWTHSLQQMLSLPSVWLCKYVAQLLLLSRTDQFKLYFSGRTQVNQLTPWLAFFVWFASVYPLRKISKVPCFYSYLGTTIIHHISRLVFENMQHWEIQEYVVWNVVSVPLPHLHYVTLWKEMTSASLHTCKQRATSFEKVRF